MGTKEPVSQPNQVSEDRPSSPLGRHRQAVFAARASPVLLGHGRQPSVLPSGSSQIVDSDEDDHVQQVCTRGHFLHQQQMQERERDFQAREAYREERRCALQEGRKGATTGLRAHDWLVVLCTVSYGLALRQRVGRRQAAGVLHALLIPIWRRWTARQKRRRWRREQDAQLWAMLEQPTGAVMEDQPFFRMLPYDAKRSLVTALRPVQYDQCAFILLEGDPGQEMYFIVSGRVDVIVRSEPSTAPNEGPKVVSKSRGRDNGMVVATLGAGAYFGEFALMNDEPRMASVQCVEATVCWALRREAFLAVMQRFSANDPLRRQMNGCIRERRAQVMARLHPLSAQQLLAVPLFTGWPIHALASLVSMVEPHVVLAGQPIFLEGASAGHIYFLACGSVQLWKKTAWWREMVAEAKCSPDTLDGKTWDREMGECISCVQRGEVFGEVGVVTLEPHPYTAQAVTTCDLWQLPRQKFKDFTLSWPTEYLDTKQLINVKRAAWIDPLRPEVLDHCVPLHVALGKWSPRMLQAVQEALVPHVACQGDTLDSNGLLFVTKGTVEWSMGPQQVSAGEVFGIEYLEDTDLPTATLRALTAMSGGPFQSLGLGRMHHYPLSDHCVAVYDCRRAGFSMKNEKWTLINPFTLTRVAAHLHSTHTQ
eukprot:GGOE01005006.1.p1 GENE.GGOE01005006.1~~GGOE01005006.1.p1  ORF type:complete len:660 (+),score=140.34 GGOE01005006.1:33-1982(+)